LWLWLQIEVLTNPIYLYNALTRLVWAAAETAADMAALRLHHQQLIHTHHAAASSKVESMTGAFTTTLSAAPLRCSTLADILVSNRPATPSLFSQVHRQIIATRLPDAVIFHGCDSTRRESNLCGKYTEWIGLDMAAGLALMGKDGFIPSADCQQPQRLSVAWGQGSGEADVLGSDSTQAGIPAGGGSSSSGGGGGAVAGAERSSEETMPPAADNSMQVPPAGSRARATRSASRSNPSVAAALTALPTPMWASRQRKRGKSPAAAPAAKKSR